MHPPRMLKEYRPRVNISMPPRRRESQKRQVHISDPHRTLTKLILLITTAISSTHRIQVQMRDLRSRTCTGIPAVRFRPVFKS
ncbi:hypothetical protein BJX76DRAFT_335868 [Aspergillus varians]